MPRCYVKDTIVDEEVNTKTNAVIRSQYVGLELGNGYQLPFKVGLGNRPAYKPGEYDIDPKAYRLNRYGKLELDPYYSLVETGTRSAVPAAK